MTKYAIKFEPIDDYYWYVEEDGWASEIHPEFTEVAVVVGNPEFQGVEDARWWQDAKELVESLDGECYGDTGRFITYFEDEYATDKLEDVAEAYENASKIDTEFIAKVAEIIYPHLHLQVSTIRGSAQGEWAILVYEDGEVDPHLAEDWYFGNVSSAYLYDSSDMDDAIDSLPIPDSLYWDMCHNGGLESRLAEMFNIPADEVTVIEE